MSTDLIPPEAIAAMLTRPQREALLWLPESGDYLAPSQEIEDVMEVLSGLEVAENVLVELTEPAVTHDDDWAWWRATALGLRVWACLEQTGERHD